MSKKPKAKLRLGQIGWLHNDHGPDYETIAWCDIHEAKLKKAGTQAPQIALYTNFRAMLEREKLDAVFIASPNKFHAEQAIAFLEAGVHVFLEKPMGITEAECRAVRDTALKAQRHCVVDFELRVSIMTQRLQSVIQSGEYGTLRRLEFFHHRGGWLEEGNGLWRTRPEQSGGLFLMEPIHAIDLFRYLGGEIASVQAFAGPRVLPHYRFEDHAGVFITFQSGTAGFLFTSHTHSAQTPDPKRWNSDMGHDMALIATFERGSVGINVLAQRMTFNRFEEYPPGSGGMRVVFDHIEDYEPAGLHAFSHDIGRMRHEFIRRLLEALPPLISIEDAYQSHQVCFAIEESIRKGGTATSLPLPSNRKKR